MMDTILSGEVTEAQIGAFMAALAAKGETFAELAGAAQAMRKKALRIQATASTVVDTCGTGGHGTHSFNISTTTAFVVAGCGVTVAKHGNRSVSSRCGSADLLEALGVRLETEPEIVEEAISEIGIGFLYAPLYHSGMRHAAGPRREIGLRSIFNMLGPLTNPAGAPNQVLGVFGEAWVEPLARVLQQLGGEHVLVVHAEDGLDEISIGAPTRVAELKNGAITVYTITPEEFGMQRSGLEPLAVADAGESLAVIGAVLDNQPGAARDIVMLNAGAAIYAAGVADSLAAGVGRAAEVLADGSAGETLASLVRVSNAV